ncbi:putative ribonuclease H-like domain-containing protein [Tanacetum coccineum]
MSLESLEVILKTHEKNEYAWGDKYEQMEYDLKIRDLKLEEKQKELDQALKERDDFKKKLEKWTNASVFLQTKYLNKQRYVSDKSCIGFGIESSSSMESDISSGDETLTDSVYENFKREKAYKAVPPPTGTIIPPRQILGDSDDEDVLMYQKAKETALTQEYPNHLIKDCNLHERTFKQTQTHKPKGTQGSRETRPVWNNIQRVNHSNFSRNSRYPHQRRSFIPSAVLTRDGLISTARPTMTQTVPSKSTANVTYQGTARSRVPQAVLSRSTDGPYYPRMDNRRPRISSYSPSSRSSNPRTTYRPQRPKKIVKSIWVKKGSTVGSQAVLPQTISVKKSAMITSKQTWRQKGNYLDSVNRDNGSYTLKQFEYVTPLGVSKIKGGYVAFEMIRKGGLNLMKRNNTRHMIRLEKVSYVEELKFNLLSVSQICDKKHNVLFTDKDCLIISKVHICDEDLLQRQRNYELFLWHRRMGEKTKHVNLKNINKLVQGNLVRGLPSKTFKIDHSCLACNKGKQHRASCKKVKERTIREPLELLHMDLFGPVSVESINKKKYCLVVTDDCSKFSWVFFLAYKDETYDMLHDLIVGLENRLRHKVKTIRCDNGTEFKNQLMNEFCAKKGIKREYSIARTPQQNGVAERKNRTLIEAARTMLADSLLPIQFWAEAVNTACYVLNRVLVTKPQMKTPYEILMGRSPNISFMRPFGCSLTILNTLDHLGDKVSTLGDVDDLDDQQFIVHTAQPMHSEERTAAKEVPLSSKEQAIHDELMKLMHQESLTIKPASTPIEAHKSLGKDEEGEDVDVHIYRSMIGCLMYLTASRPDIMFAVCLCARFQVTPKVSHLHAVKRIFRYLKHQPKLGLWYPKDSPFHLEAFSDSDYAGDNHDRRSTSGGCQYLGRRLVSWQCKKQTIVAISSTEAEYVAAASCCAQVLWMQNQLLDYGFNFMNTEIHIDNESTICIVRNPVFHSKTKHIQIRHHFIRDCYEQRLINVVKVHTDDNVADLLTKGFDLARFNFLVVTIGMINP